MLLLALRYHQRERTGATDPQQRVDVDLVCGVAGEGVLLSVERKRVFEDGRAAVGNERDEALQAIVRGDEEFVERSGVARGVDRLVAVLGDLLQLVRRQVGFDPGGGVGRVVEG